MPNWKWLFVIALYLLYTRGGYAAAAAERPLKIQYEFANRRNDFAFRSVCI